MNRPKTILLRLKITILLSTVFFLFVQAQPIIQEIRFEGLTKTKESFLLPLLECQTGTEYTVSKVETDVQTLVNVESIGWASFQLVDSSATAVSIVFTLREVRTLLPIVNFGGLRDNFWFQLGFLDNNWGGKGRDVQFFYQNIDKRHGGQLFYREPSFKGGSWGYTFDLLKYASSEPLFFPEGTVLYDYDLYSIGASVLKNFGIRRLAEVGTTVFIENYEQTQDQPLSDPPGPGTLEETKLLGKLAYGEDHRNFDEFSLSRNQWNVRFQQVYNFRDNSLFLSLIATYHHFWRLREKSNLALRGRLGIATNKDSPFAPFVVDSYFNLRGVGNRIDRGTAQLVFNLEWRETVFNKRHWAGQIVAFTDMGGWREPGGDLEDLVDPDQFMQFAGGGIRLIYKKIFDAVLRLDYGVNINDRENRGFVLGFGQYF